MAALVFVVIKMFDTFARIFWLSVILLESWDTQREKKKYFPLGKSDPVAVDC